MLPLLSLAIVLHITNVADAPHVIVERAQREVSRLYRGIGVDIVWAGLDVPDYAAVDDMHVVLRSYEGGALERDPRTVMGAAVRTDRGRGIAYVFYRRVEREARQYGSSEAHVLACAIAHEIAHLLMPGRDHSALGLMRARWDRDDFSRAERGQLRFTDEEAALIRARVADGPDWRASGGAICALCAPPSTSSSAQLPPCAVPPTTSDVCAVRR